MREVFTSLPPSCVLVGTSVARVMIICTSSFIPFGTEIAYKILVRYSQSRHLYNIKITMKNCGTHFSTRTYFVAKPAPIFVLSSGMCFPVESLGLFPFRLPPSQQDAKQFNSSSDKIML